MAIMAMSGLTAPKVRTIVVVGCYASGKSTLIKNLSNSVGFEAHAEVGGVLRSKAKCISSESCAVFDELVMLREIERDESLLQVMDSGNSVLLEQWHFGNLAYSKVRNPQIVPEYFSRLERVHVIQRFQPLVLFLELDPNLIASRVVYERTEQVLQDSIFYVKWTIALREILADLQTPYVSIDASGSPNEVLRRALKKLSSKL